MKKFLSALLAFTLFASPVFAAKITPDTYDKLFLRMDGTTTSFVDSSTANPKTITANGNAKQLSLHADFAGKRTAGFFNGTTDYVAIPSHANFAPGTGAFDITVYFNTTAAATAQTILDTRTTTASTAGFLLNIINSSGNKLCFTTATTARITGTTTLAVNTWYKARVVGNGGADGARTVILYLNDVQEGSTYTNNYNFTEQTFRLGSIYQTAGTYFSGWMKNLTITKAGTTVLDMKFDSPANSPLGPAIYFDGTGDYLSTDTGTGFNVGTGDFVLEGFYNQDVGYTTACSIFDSGSGGYNGIHGLVYSNDASSGTMDIFIGSGVPALAVTGLTHKRGVWNHFAWERKSGVLKAYLNGREVGSVANTTNFTATTPARIGANNAGGSLAKGFMREVRFSSTWRYGGAFTPSQTGFTVDANTKLYIKGNENNGVTTFVDSETSPKTVTTAGNTIIKYTEDYRSCIFKDETGKFPYPVGSAKVDFFAPFGTGAGYFSGGSDYLTASNSSGDFTLGTGDYTSELYLRVLSYSSGGYCQLFGNYANGMNFDLDNGSTRIQLYSNGSTTYYTAPTTTAVNSWVHIAAARRGTSLRVFWNGTQIGSTSTDSTNLSSPDNPVKIGIGGGGSEYGTKLYDNFRYSKGIARYTSTFNPPEDYETTTRRRGSHFFFF